ncbi:MAG: hypothetical protein IKH32_02010 [Prevotella sp.]|nr:hypothetical protein [Prevotella sp.]
MAWKLKYRCKQCGYEAEVYEGRGLFRQQITPMICPDCKTIQNIVVGGIIADVAPSYRSEVGRLCLNCGSDNIRIWDMKTCPKCASKREQSDACINSTEREHTQPEVKCQGDMEPTGEKEFWT